MDLDVLKLKVQEYQRLRNELIHEIPKLVNKAGIILNIVHSIYTEDFVDTDEVIGSSIIKLDRYISDLKHVHENTSGYLDYYLITTLDLISEINQIEAVLADIAN